MLIDRIKKKVEFFINTENRGNFTPTSFELALHNAIQARNEEYFYDLNRLITKENRGFITAGLSNVAEKYSEKILHYLEEQSITPEPNGRVILPSDWRYLDEVEMKYDASDDPLIINSKIADLEFCKNKREFNNLKNFATKQYPVFLMIQNELLIAPLNEASSIALTYLRKPKYPKWTYNEVGGNGLFNPNASDFQDADIHSSEEDEVVMRVLKAFGVNLKETDLQSYTMQEESNDFNQENA